MSNIKFNQYITQFLERYEENTRTKETYSQILNKISADLPDLIIDDFRAMRRGIDNYTYTTRSGKVRTLCGNSKISFIKTLKTYINYCSFCTREVYDTKRHLKTYDASPTNRVNGTPEQKRIIHGYLPYITNKYHRPDLQFKAIFELLENNYCRIGEFCQINWNICENPNGQFSKEENLYFLEHVTEKHGNVRRYCIPKYIAEGMPYIDMPKNSIKRKFAELQKIVHEHEPELRNVKIFTHMHRYNAINDMNDDGATIADIAKCTGHKSHNVVYNHYLKNNFSKYAQLQRKITERNEQLDNQTYNSTTNTTIGGMYVDKKYN